MPSDSEARLRALEREIAKLKKAAADTARRAGALAQQMSMEAGGGAPAAAGLTPFIGKTSSAGISAATTSAGGTATVTLYDLTAWPTLTLTATVVTAKSPFPDALAGIYRVEGFVIGGVYTIYSAACTTG